MVFMDTLYGLVYCRYDCRCITMWIKVFPPNLELCTTIFLNKNIFIYILHICIVYTHILWFATLKKKENWVLPYVGLHLDEKFFLF